VCRPSAYNAPESALVHGLLTGSTPRAAVELANAAGAIVASRLLCSDAMPTLDELRAALDGRTDSHATR
jgi:5-dehydro-2-deoxygluconokinase